MKFYRLSGAIFYDCINTIYQFIKPFFDKKCLFLMNRVPLSLFICSSVVHKDHKPLLHTYTLRQQVYVMFNPFTA